MKYYGYTAMPIVNGNGKFKGIISESYILHEIKRRNIINDKDLEKVSIMEIPHIFEKKHCYIMLLN